MLLLALAPFASAANHEFYGGLHHEVRHSPEAFGLGTTVQLGYRLHLGRVTGGVAFRVGALQDPATGLKLELGLHLRPKKNGYKPWIGLEAVGLGHRDTQMEDAKTWVRGADLRVAIRPFAFHFGPVTLSFLELDFGQRRGPDWRQAIGVNPLQIGMIL